MGVRIISILTLLDLIGEFSSKKRSNRPGRYIAKKFVVAASTSNEVWGLANTASFNLDD